MQQKKHHVKQLTLCSNTGDLIGGTADGIGKACLKGVELSPRLSNQRSLTQHLLVQAPDYSNLRMAYQQVKTNKGSSGVDGMSIEAFRIWLGKHHEMFIKSIVDERYEVEAVREVNIPKPTGGTRMLGIPTVKDRVIQ